MSDGPNKSEAQIRKDRPVFSGVLKYFPDALLEVAELSRIGNDQHNPGQPLHWARGKSTDHNDALLRHLIDTGTRDSDGVRHAAKVAWRALAQLQTEIENERYGGEAHGQQAYPEDVVDYAAVLSAQADVEGVDHHGPEHDAASISYRYTHEDRPYPRTATELPPRYFKGSFHKE